MYKPALLNIFYHVNDCITGGDDMVVHRLMGWHGFCMLKRSVNRCERFKKRLKWNNILAKGDVYIKKNSTFVVSFRRRNIL